LLCCTSTKTVWEALLHGGDLTDLQTRVPDEFHAWLRTTVADLRARHDKLDAAARTLYAEIVKSLPDGYSRKEFAEQAVPHREKALLFRLLDGASIDDMIWKQIEPDRAVPFRQDNDS
jgi:RNA ligase